MTDLNVLESIFFAALEKPLAEQTAFLDAACGGDADLRARVERLLAAHPNVGSFLEPPGTASFPVSSEVAETADRPGKDEYVGAILAGKYKLIEAIGDGGMGSVFLAQQTEPVKRAVAVKVIKAGMDSKAVLARFEAERQALAMMDHPNIARVLDAGTTESGRPFFVMELVKGVPITQFCDERKLTPRQRLELFVPVCQAIQHAHQKGIIHRDIKPSNVLVALYDDRPVPKVIDFGVAKATGQTLTDKTLMTGFGAVVGTPEYMSPEQASLNNLDIDTRSDVYSLGVLLYELLTGSTPVDRKSLGKAALLEVLRIVREVEAPKPSAKLSTIDTLPSVAANRGTEPAKLSKLMKGELDWLVLKALEKDRTRRYESANGLARDIQRYLADEVVEARPPSTSYRLKKFVRRHKGQVLAAGLVLLTLLAGIAGTTWGLFRADAARQAEADQRAAVERERDAKEAALVAVSRSRIAARTALDAMTSRVMEDWIAREGPLTDSTRAFLQDALARYSAFAAEQSDDRPTQIAIASAHHRVGVILFRLGQHQQAVSALERAIEHYRGLTANRPPEVEMVIARLDAESVRRQVFAASGEQNQDVTGIERELLTQAEQLVADHPDHLPALNLAVNLMDSIVRAQLKNGGDEKTLALIDRLEQLCRRVEHLRPDTPHAARYASLLNNRYVIRQRLGKAVSREDKAEVLRMYEQLAEKSPPVVEALSGAGRMRMNLGIDYRTSGELERSLVEFEKAERWMTALISEYPGISSYRAPLGQLYLCWADALRDLGRPEAATIGRMAYSTWDRLVRSTPDDWGHRHGLAAAVVQLAELALTAGDYERARGYHRDAEKQYEAYIAKMGAGYWTYHDLIRLHRNQAELAEREKDIEAAATAWGKAVANLDRLNRPSGIEQIRQAKCLVQIGRTEEGIRRVEQLLLPRQGTPATTPNGLYLAACVYAAARQPDEEKRTEYHFRAMELLQRAVKAGYTNAARLKKEPDLDPLRGREEYKKLIAELDKMAEKK